MHFFLFSFMEFIKSPLYRILSERFLVRVYTANVKNSKRNDISSMYKRCDKIEFHRKMCFISRRYIVRRACCVIRVIAKLIDSDREFNGRYYIKTNFRRLICKRIRERKKNMLNNIIQINATKLPYAFLQRFNAFFKFYIVLICFIVKFKSPSSIQGTLAIGTHMILYRVISYIIRVRIYR